MTKPLTILTLLLLTLSTKAQTSNIIEKRVDSLRFLKQQPFDCNSVYWRVVATGKDAIPFLISKLTDTTKTQVSLKCKSRNVRFGDICFEALTEIFNIPLFYVTQQQFDVIIQGCQQGVFTYLNDHRQKFQSQVQQYYDKFKSDIKFVKYDKDYKSACKKKHGILGYYDVDWKLL